MPVNERMNIGYDANCYNIRKPRRLWGEREGASDSHRAEVQAKFPRGRKG